MLYQNTFSPCLETIVAGSAAKSIFVILSDSEEFFAVFSTA